MSRLSKRMKDAHKAIGTIESPLPLQEAVNRLAKAPKVKFDETVELHFNLNLDLKASDQGVRGTVVLPHGIGKKVRVAAFCKGDAATKAQAAGADYVGDNDLIEKVGMADFLYKNSKGETLKISKIATLRQYFQVNFDEQAFLKKNLAKLLEPTVEPVESLSITEEGGEE